MSLIPIVAFAFLGITNFLNEASATIGCQTDFIPIPKEEAKEAISTDKPLDESEKEYYKGCKDNVKLHKELSK